MGSASSSFPAPRSGCDRRAAAGAAPHPMGRSPQRRRKPRITAQLRRGSIGGNQGGSLVLSRQRGGQGQQQESQSTPGWGLA